MFVFSYVTQELDNQQCTVTAGDHTTSLSGNDLVNQRAVLRSICSTGIAETSRQGQKVRKVNGHVAYLGRLSGCSKRVTPQSLLVI